MRKPKHVLSLLLSLLLLLLLLLLLCCLQGFVYSSAMPAAGSPNTITPAYTVTLDQLRSECEDLFGSKLPPLKVPAVADPTAFKALVRKVGGLVFANGNADGWSGGSYYSYMDLAGPTVGVEDVQGFDSSAARRPAATAAAAAAPAVLEDKSDAVDEPNRSLATEKQAAAAAGDVGSKETQQALAAAAAGAEPTGKRPKPSAAFVVYAGGSHCTDLNSRNFANPAQPAVYVAQRVQAMDAAVRFMRRHAVE
jgi:hypothetical protein